MGSKQVVWKSWARIGIVGAVAAAASISAAYGSIAVEGQYTAFPWTTATNVVIGSNSYGKFTMDAGQQVSVNSFIAGDQATGIGYAIITGANTKLTVDGVLYSGDAGYGSIKIENGATVKAATVQASITLGDSQSAGGIGVKGAGSLLDIANNGFISPGGNGLLSVTEGGEAKFGGTLNFSYYSNSVSSLVLQDAGSKITTGILSTGAGQSDLDIYNGAIMNAATANIGLMNGKTNISVNSGTWNSNVFNIGGNNVVDFQIAGGGVGNLGTIVADGGANNSPTLSVYGAGSKLYYTTMTIGEDKGAKFVSQAGAVATGGDVIIGKNADSKGNALIDGGSLKAGNITLGKEAQSSGVMDVKNNGIVTGTKLTIGSMGKGTVTNTGGKMTVNVIELGGASGANGYLTVDGNSAKVYSGVTAIGNGGVGNITLTNRGIVDGGITNVGTAGTGSGTINASGGFYYATDLNVGRTAGFYSGYMTIENGGVIRADSLSLNAASSVTMYDGTLSFNDLFVHSSANIEYYAGIIEWRGDHEFVANKPVNRFFNNTSKVNFGQEFHITGLADFKTPFEIDGGVLAVGTMGKGKILFTRGTFAIYDGGFNVEGGAVFGDTLNIRSDTYYVAQYINNNGLITGNGNAKASMHNTAAGRMQVGLGNRLHFGDGADYGNHTNDGLIELNGGTIHFDGQLENRATGTIKGYGTLQVDNQYDNNGLNNKGSIYLTGNAGVIGNVNNTNLIALSGTSPNVFYNNVKNNGEIRVSEGSHAVFLGEYSGAGQITGGGKTFFEGGLAPGNSPAIMMVDGNVKLGANSVFDVELGGLLAGTEHDKLEVTGKLEIGGTLRVSLYDLGAGVFNPQAGDSFDILDWGTLAGTFSDLQLAQLSDGLGWDLSQLYTTGVISVGVGSSIPEPASLLALSAGCIGLLMRRGKRG